ncbi:MAG: hypothetical protein ACRCX2_24185 [Paraclostridium sp.]
MYSMRIKEGVLFCELNTIVNEKEIRCVFSIGLMEENEAIIFKDSVTPVATNAITSSLKAVDIFMDLQLDLNLNDEITSRFENIDKIYSVECTHNGEETDIHEDLEGLKIIKELNETLKQHGVYVKKGLFYDITEGGKI